MKKVKKKILLLLLLVIGSFMYMYAFSFAKYVSDTVLNYYFETKGFYFSSDNLAVTTVKNVNTLWDGGNVNFNIRNNLNQAIITDYDINYSLVCTVEGAASSYTECRLNGTSLNTLDSILVNSKTCINITNDGINVSSYNQEDCESGGYEWTNEVVIDDHYFNVILTNGSYEITDVTVKIVATSNSPYTKTLEGEFILHNSNIEEDNLVIEYDNYSNYDRLIISNSYSTTKCVKVSWDSSDLIIHADTSEFSSYSTDINDYINEIKFNIGAKKSVSHIFYRKDFAETYDTSAFSVEEASGC